MFTRRSMAIARGAFSFHIARQHVSLKPLPSQSSPSSLHTASTTVIKSPNLYQKQKDYAKPDEKNNEISYNDDERKLFLEALSEEDLEEKFVRGSGPGGQKVNKTSNCVELKHKETGIIVKCHESRSLEQNRKVARVRLLEKLRFLFNSSESTTQKKIDDKKKKKTETVRKRRMKEEATKNRIDI